MNEIKKHKEEVLYFALLLFAFFPLIPNAIKGLSVVLLGMAAMLNYTSKKPELKLFIGFSFLYFLYLFSLFQTSNFDYAYKKLETSLSTLIIPFIFFILIPDFQLSDKLKKSFAKLFVFSTTLFAIISIIAIWFDKTPYYDHLYSDKFRNVTNELPFIGQHPIYASFFLAISLLFIVYLYLQTKKKTLFIPFLINLIFLFMLSSKGVIISLTFIAFFFIFFIVKIKWKTKIYLLITLFIGISSIFLLNRRMQELFHLETYKKINPKYSNSYRVAINKCSLELIKKHWMLGYGFGDVQDELDACYAKNDFEIKARTHNSHNQYFDIWLKTGLLGFLYLVGFIMYLLFISLKRKKYLLFSILILYSINFLFENMFSRQSGVILFYFLIIFLFLENEKGRLYIQSKINN